MALTRPEIGAELDHICIQSSDPERLADFFIHAYDMTKSKLDDYWMCQGPERQLLIKAGKPKQLGYMAFGFNNLDALTNYKERLATEDVVIEESPSPIFLDDGFSVIDPDGNQVVFGVSTKQSAQPTGRPAARLQHLAVRTPDPQGMMDFYSKTLHFVVSDRVKNSDDELTACFLRSDHEHHALALFGIKGEPIHDHVSFETESLQQLTDWADYVAAEKAIPIHWGVGRHGPGNDIFFMVLDPDGNLVEISCELEVCDADRPAYQWAHEERTLNLWGKAIMRN